MNQPQSEKLESADPRILFAAERTLLAWVRTGLALMGFGFVVARFGLFLRELAAARGNAVPTSRGESLWFGVGLVVLGVFVLIGSTYRFRSYVNRLNQGNSPQVPGLAFSLVVTAVLVVIGAGLVVYLISSY